MDKFWTILKLCSRHCKLFVSLKCDSGCIAAHVKFSTLGGMMWCQFVVTSCCKVFCQIDVFEHLDIL